MVPSIFKVGVSIKLNNSILVKKRLKRKQTQGFIHYVAVKTLDTTLIFYFNTGQKYSVQER